MKERMKQLTDQLNEANHRYYVLDNPTMPDFEYDRLLRELENLEAEYPEYALADSPTKRVGGEALSKFEKVNHPVPLMSLQDVFSLEELDDFLEKILADYPGNAFTVEPKLLHQLMLLRLKLMDFLLPWNMRTVYLFGAQPAEMERLVRMSLRT